MRIKTLVSAAAIALVAGLGSASAGEQFTTLQGFQPPALTATELKTITGQSNLSAGGGNFGVVFRTTIPAEGTNGGPNRALGNNGVDLAEVLTVHLSCTEGC